MAKGRILVVDDEESIAEALRTILQAEGYQVRTAGSANRALQEVDRNRYDLAIVDLVLPDLDGLELLKRLKEKHLSMEVVVVTAHGSIPAAVEATKQGAFYFIEKPFGPDEITLILAKALERKALVEETSTLRARLAGQAGRGGIIGSSPAMKGVFELLDAVAKSDASVLIMGESGTGKELVANAVHAESPRAQGPFIKINCAALPKDLMESELFGYSKGAFTGATTDKPGLFEEAHTGSLLLDEIAEMPAPLQAKLLRVLEERETRRLGSTKAVAVDFRLIASTNRDVETALKEGVLREDLYYRLSTVTLRLPPLRERRDDIPLLAHTFMGRFQEKYRKEPISLAPEALRVLQAYAWPGNARELEHAMERAVLVARGKEIGVADLPEAVIRGSGEAPGSAPDLPPGSLEEIERLAILNALEATGWNKQAAAQRLGLHRPTLYSKMRRHGIPLKRAAAGA